MGMTTSSTITGGTSERPLNIRIMHTTIMEPRRRAFVDQRGLFTFAPSMLRGTILGMTAHIDAAITGQVTDHWIGMQWGTVTADRNLAAGWTRPNGVYGSDSELWGVRPTFERLDQLSLITKYLCAAATASSIQITRVRLHLHYTV